ncbi:MAG: glycosyltransferase [Desulfurococcaceae archaeon]
MTSLRLYGNMPHKYKITPHGHFIGYYGEKIEKSIARESLNIPVDALILCFLGGLRVYKGLELLRKVLPELLLEFPQLYVIIAGKPHDSQAISYLRQVCAHDRVLCNLRYLSQEEILLHVSACDLGLIPYQQITTPGSAILYASYGVPIITSKKCAILELFEDGVFYYYETFSIIDSLKEILRKILENIHCLDVTGDLLKKIVQEHDWGSIAEVHKNQYQLLCILKG